MNRKEAGYTVLELLVAMGLLSIIGALVGSSLAQQFHRVVTESKVALASLELKNAVQLLSTELRMGAAVSPYLPGNSPSSVVCKSLISVTPTTIKFLVAHDEASGTNGRSVYYVGYRFDPVTRTLYRGQILSPSSTSCALPAGDPTANTESYVLAKNIVQVDGNGDGTVDPVFSYAQSALTVSLGISVDTQDSTTLVQKIRTNILVRSA